MIEKKYHTGRVELNYGEGKANGIPVLLIHGSGSIWQDWQSVFNAFSTEYHIYAIDLRGFGGSARVAGTYNLATFADDLADFIKGVLSERPVVVGHSLGALITIDLAGRYPDLLRSVVLEDPPVSILENFSQWDGLRYYEIALDVKKNNASFREAILRFVSELGYSLTEAERVARNLAVIDPEIFAQILDGKLITLNEDITIALGRIQCPCLFVSSNEKLGSLVHQKDLPRVKKSLPNGQFALIDNVGHGIHLEAAEAFNQVLGVFLLGQK